jgi:hypothetical protein
LGAGDKLTALGATGAVAGTVEGAVRPDGKVPAKLAGALAGAPVLDARGNIVGVAAGDGYVPVAAAFRALNLGVTLTEN